MHPFNDSVYYNKTTPTSILSTIVNYEAYKIYGTLKQFVHYFRNLFKVDVFHRVVCMPLSNQQCVASLQMSQKKKKLHHVVNMFD